MLSALSTDLRLASRTLVRSPGLAATAVAVLALGIAATVVAFTVVNEIFLRPLPVGEQDRLVDVWAEEPGGNSFAGFGWPDVMAYRESVQGDGPIQELAAFAGVRSTLGEGAGRRPVIGQLVSEGYFPLLRVGAELGSVDLEEDPGFGGPRTTVLSHALWTDAFAADPGVVGRSIVIDGEAFSVVGVAERGFQGHFIGFPVDLWLPITAAELVLPGFDPRDPGRMPFEMIGRLRGGAGALAAREALTSVATTLEARYPETHRGHGIGVTPTTGVDHSLRPVVVTFVGVVTGLAVLVLLVACLNVGSLLLVRTLARESELAVRTALGAGRGRLVRLLLTEATVLTGLGAAAGLSLSRAVVGQVDALFRALAPGLGLELPLDVRVMLLTAAAAALAALVAGAAPAWHILRRSPARSLRGRSPQRGASRGRAILVGVQVAVSVALVITTGLFLRALSAGARVDPGFAADEVATFVFAPEAPEDAEAQEALLRDLRALPGVRAVSLADGPPTGVARTPMSLGLPGLEPPPGEEGWTVDVRRVGTGYLDAVGVSVLRGRDFQEADTREGPPVAVVSQAFVDRFWPGEDPLGRSIEVGAASATVVGVARDARTLVQDDTPDPFVYLSLAGTVLATPVITLRSGNPGSLTPSVRAAVQTHAPGRPPARLVPARETLGTGLLAQRLGAVLAGGIGATALLLAAVGLYGLLQYSVSQDRQAFAVRLALGGRRTGIMGSVLRSSLALVAAGAAGGVLLAAVGSPVLSSFLLGVRPRDPLTYGAVVVLFLGVAVLASVLPARRAMAVPPAAVLRGA
jgi:predicted permease